MHYLVKFKVEEVEDWSNFYIAPEGDRGWSIIEAESEEALRSDLEEGKEVEEGRESEGSGETGEGREAEKSREIEEVQPLLPAHEYVAISKAREELDASKRRFVDDPSGALQEAREAVGQAMEACGYSRNGGSESSSESRSEVMEEYEKTNVGESSDLEEMREAFDQLSRTLQRLAGVQLD